MRWTLLLFLVACEGAPTDKPDGDDVPAAQTGSLRVLTYNVHGLPDIVTGSDHDLGGADRMARIAPLLRDFDLVGLQEDWQAPNHAILVDDAAQSVADWFDTPRGPDRAYGAGLTQLAGVGTVQAYAETWYDTCYGFLDGASDCFASKGFQAMTLDLGDGAVLTWLNTHHEAGSGPEDDVARTAQVSQVLDALDALPADHAVLFTGDFNLHGGDPEDAVELGRYEAAGLRNGCKEVSCPEPDRIDILWVRDGTGLALQVDDWAMQAAFVDDQGQALSDHDALAITLTWQRP